MRKLFFFMLLFSVTVLHGQVFTMLKDIAPGTVNSTGTRYYFCVLNGKVFFRANDNSVLNNFELWTTDGTVSGTNLFKDIDPAIGSNPNYMTVINGKMLFAANDPVASYEFFASDGTTAGTTMLKDIDPGFTLGSSNPSFPNNFSVMNGELYFSAKQVGTGTELWKSDGTAAGTVMIKEINPGPANAIATVNYAYLSMNGFLYFAATEPGNGTELWRTDGTSAGTTMVKDINPGTAAGNPIYYFGIINNELFFAATTAANGTELWKTDGTAAGTVMVKDINPGTGGALQTTTLAAQVNGYIYFSANDGVTGTELYRTDGTTAGTVLIKDVNPGAASGSYVFPAVSGNTVYFSGNDGVNGAELWTTDGTAAGTVMVKDINPGAASSNPGNLTNIGGIMVFNAATATYGMEPWRTDGTAAHTEMIEDVAVGTAGSSPGEYKEYNGKIYATMTTPATGYELWVSDVAVVVPLRLLEFRGTLVNGQAQLNWKTAEEVNTLEFIIEKSADGKSFKEVGRVAAINSPGTFQYRFTDKSLPDPNFPKIYYRLKQADIDGKFTWSPVIALTVPGTHFSTGLFPNPAGNETTLILRSNYKQRVSLRIFDASGKLVRQHPVNVNAGVNVVAIQTAAFPPGFYRFSIDSGNAVQTLSFVKQ